MRNAQEAFTDEQTAQIEAAVGAYRWQYIISGAASAAPGRLLTSLRRHRCHDTGGIGANTRKLNRLRGAGCMRYTTTQVAEDSRLLMWALLGFASWTLLLLMTTVGVTGGLHPAGTPADGASFDQVKDDWYRRSVRHTPTHRESACLGAIVLTLYVSGVAGPIIDRLSIAVVCPSRNPRFTYLMYKLTHSCL
jgi:hypothetical protein